MDKAVDEPKKKGWALLAYDLKQRKLIPTKIIFFVVLSSIGVLLPYMTIHMKSLGISVQETAVIYGVFPLFAILAPYSMGMVADKLGNFKVLLSVIFLLAMTTALLFLVIPTGRYIDNYPANISLAIGCDPSARAGLILTDLDSITCGSRPPSNLTVTITDCGYVCYDGDDSPTDPQVSLPSHWPTADQPHKKHRKAIFFRDKWSLDVSCSVTPLGGAANCTLERSAWPAARNLTFNQINLGDNRTDGVFPIDTFLFNGVQPLNYRGIQCGSAYDKPVRLSRPLAFTLNNTLHCDSGTLGDLADAAGDETAAVYKVCRAQCIGKTSRRNVCSDNAHVVVFEPQLTFWTYLLLRVVFAMLLGSGMVMLEGACLAVVVEYKGDLGLQRMFGILGTMIFSPISGALIDRFSVNQDIPDYRPAFYLYAVLVGIASMSILAVDLDFKPPAKNLVKDMKSILKNVELDVFFLVVFLSGLFWGYIESYLFWFLEEMGGTKSLMGLTVTVSSVFGIPALLVSDAIFRRIGHPNVQVIGFLVYIIRLIGYSYVYNPYMCLIYEAMEAITTSLMMTSAVAYSAQLGSTTTLATIQGMIGGTYYGLGRGAGSFVGGFLMKAYGTRWTFRILGVASLVTAFCYFLFNQFYIRRRQLDEKAKAVKSRDAEDGVVNPVFVPDDAIDHANKNN